MVGKMDPISTGRVGAYERRKLRLPLTLESCAERMEQCAM